VSRPPGPSGSSTGTPSAAAPTAALVLTTTSPDDTRALARTLAAHLDRGDLLVLNGDLGAGKTCFTQGLALGLGVDEPVTSPTFTLANRYQGRVMLHHLDVYRLDGPADAIDLDLDDLLDTGVTVIEWGDRITDALPDGCFVLTLRYPPTEADPTGGLPAGVDRAGAEPAELDHRVIDLVGPLDRAGLRAALAPWEHR
jgi:tRNA threonylcarbamoyladenosine biosynthesis protein TsaE